MTDPTSLLVNIALFGTSPAITVALDAARAAAKHVAPVLLVAEPGLEVTILAIQIHEWSKRTGPLQRVHAAELAVPNLDTRAGSSPLSGLIALPLLLETIRNAKGGTLVIEEIDALPESGQAIVESLLNQQSLSAATSDVRVIASTSHDLGNLASRGSFRTTLLDRLLYTAIYIPPLRDRQQDVLILAERILGSHRLLHGRQGVRLSEPARQVLQAHRWPGNCVELERVIVRAAFEATDGTIRADHVSRAIDEPGEVFKPLNAHFQPLGGELLTAGRLAPAPGNFKSTLGEAIERTLSQFDKIAEQKETISALLDGLVSLRDHVVLRELARVEKLTLKDASALLDLEAGATKRHMGRLVRSGKLVAAQESANKPVWSLAAKA